jgi:hypothetical protein
VWRNVEETVTKKKLKCLGHWETRETCGGGLFGGHGRCNDSCNDPCNNACPRTRKVWVYCPQYECCEVKVCKRVCCEEKVKCKVPVCRNEWREEKVKVCTYECRTTQKKETYTECVTRKVPCKIERTVRVCVPHEETVTCTRMVRRCVEREVACPAPACNDSCRPSLCDRLHDAFSRNRCNADCDRGCRKSDCH